MHQQSDSPGEQTASDIFGNLHSDERQMYDYGVRKIRKALFIAGGLMLVSDIIGLAQFSSGATSAQLWIAVGVTLFFVSIFVLLGLWATKQPFTALVLGLAVFLGIQVLAAAANPASIFQGLLVKAIIIISLAFWIKQARHLQKMRRLIGH